MMLGLEGSMTLKLGGEQLTCEGKYFSWESGGQNDEAYLFVYDEEGERVEMTLDIKNEIITEIIRVTWNWEVPTIEDVDLEVTYN
ncbi:MULTISPECIES: hypothetical protein [unclassified Halomonas]|uniref:hypothetical protein n=1 Tax=unclassified Halomonas TaxID=2609666 RepID=UPI0007D93519|nr:MULTISPECIES: hypothetical protein [unclassified Halomonas]MBT2784773.1 hypothetical protein [Halomonas sp. ISL-106]MBT2796467.1 hypothetical protein [Halomonas sp. ISL-104]OAL59717.1 hypothetical protein A6R74_00100 [Halomonas sp. ALS9]